MGKLWTSITRLFSDTWIWEVLSLTFSLSCFVVVIGLLLNYDGKVFPELPQGITFNAILSLLAAGAKASFLTAVAASFAQYKWLQLDGKRKQRSLAELQALDDASRGPWGALMVAFRANNSVVIILGAVVTVLALGFEPFIQQTVSYRSEVVYERSGTARMPFAASYTLGPVAFTDNPELAFPRNVLQSSFLGQDVSLPQAQPMCQSGNCTWPPYAILGLCSHCLDVTSHAKADYHCADRICHQRAIDGSDQHISWVGNDLLDLSSLVVMRTSSVASNWTARTQYKIPDPLFAMETIWYNQKGVPKQAFGCGITFCSRTRTASSVNGHLSIEETAVEYPTPQPAVLAQTEPIGDDWAITFRSANGKVSNADTLFKVNNASASTLRSLLTDVFVYYQIGDYFQYSVFFVQDNAYTPVELLFNDTNNLPKLSDRATLAYTDFMQNGSTTFVEGNAGTLKTRVRVRWPWIAYPSALLALAILFFVSTVLATKTTRMMIWKSSVMALLYHGLDVVPHGAGDMQVISEMDEHAESIKARLGKTNKGWKILTVGRRNSQTATGPITAQSSAPNSAPAPLAPVTAQTPQSPPAINARTSGPPIPSQSSTTSVPAPYPPPAPVS